MYINISRRSLSETRYLIEFASKLALITPEKIKELEKLCSQIGIMLTALTRSIREKSNDRDLQERRVLYIVDGHAMLNC